MKCWCGAPATIDCGQCEAHHWETHVAWRKEPLMCKEQSQKYIEQGIQLRQYQQRVAQLEAEKASLQAELDAERMAAHSTSTTVDL